MGYVLLAAISAVGLVASATCHLAGWLGADLPYGKLPFAAMHVGVFLVWIPLVLCANRTMPKDGKGNVDHLLAELPVWVRVSVGVLFAYAIGNFLLFMWKAREFPKGQVPYSLELRGFSGHWIMFYGVAWAGFVGLGRLARKRRTRPNT
jgi:hypothetical protein